jgi:hypothetical protein
MSLVIIPTGFRGVIEMQAEGIIVQPTSVSDQFNASIGGSNIGGMGNTDLIQHHYHYTGPSSLHRWYVSTLLLWGKFNISYIQSYDHLYSSSRRPCYISCF